VSAAPITSSPLLDELLASGAGALGADRTAYRNHAYRVLNLALALVPDASPDDRRKLEIACYFHDVGIWTDATFDYLEPSARRARAYLEAHGLAAWNDEVTRMITEHHALFSARRHGPLVEALRRADWADVSLGLLRGGVPGAFVREVRRALPNCGFHRRLVELGAAWTWRHPLRPLPMMRW
jgi:hypothetical protein